MAIVVLVALIAVAVVVLVAGGSDGDADRPVRSDAPARTVAPVPTVRSKLTLERFVVPTTGQPEELVVSLPDQRLNILKTTGGETTVLLRCVDKSGAVRIRRETAWPLLVEEGYPPHIHQLVRPEVLDSIRGCRLTSARIDFAGRVPGRVPRGQ